MSALTWAGKVRPSTKLLMLRLKLPRYLCNAGFICLKEDSYLTFSFWHAGNTSLTLAEQSAPAVALSSLPLPSTLAYISQSLKWAVGMRRGKPGSWCT